MNIELVQWLEARKIISSSGKELLSDGIRVNLFRS